MEHYYPLPVPDAQTRTYWEGAALGELRYQCCGRCQHVQRIPRSLCEQCQCAQLEWAVSGGTGTLLTYTTVYRAPLPVFKERVPYIIAIVDMDEGFRLMANVLPSARDGMKIGVGVRIGFQQIQGMALPVVLTILESVE